MTLRSQRGETIIEVMLSILVLGFTLTSVFVIARRSLSTGQAASERSQALAIVESQIERLRYLADGDVTEDNKNIYRDDGVYCITEDLIVSQDTDGNTDCFGSFPDSNLTLEVSYSEQGPDTISEFDNDTFTITARWTRVSGGGEEVLNLVYRLPKQEAIALTSPLTPPEPDPLPPTCQVLREMLGSDTYRLNWTITDATSATFSSGGAPASIPPTNGSRDVGPLSAGSSTTYTITVQNGAGSGTCSNVVTIPAAPNPCNDSGVTFNLASYIRTKGLLWGAKTIFDPYYNPGGGDRRDIIPDLILNSTDFPPINIDPNCSTYELTFTAYCNSSSVGANGTVPGPPTRADCGLDQPNEAARIELHSGYQQYDNEGRDMGYGGYNCSGTQNPTGVFTPRPTRIGYFDTFDNPPSINYENDTSWTGTVPSSSLGVGTVRCINFVHICAAVPLTVPPNCGNRDASVYFYDITIRGRQ